MWLFALLLLPAIFAQCCKDPNAEIRNGNCVCKENYIDISTTGEPYGHSYKQGEWCVLDKACENVKDLSINFIVDSSSSIFDDNSNNWNIITRTLGDVSKLLPKETKVSLVKFGSNVTFAGTLHEGWTTDEFRNFVNKTFDNSDETNTPAALRKAAEMFTNDKSKNKVAVLFTDGLPYSYSIETHEMASEITRQAALELRKNVPLVIFAFGSLYASDDNIEIVKQWVENPEEDFCGYDRIVRFMKPTNMEILLEKVCGRFRS